MERGERGRVPSRETRGADAGGRRPRPHRWCASAAAGLLLAAAGLLGPGGALPAAARDASPGERFEEAITVTEVVVPVQVLHRGEPVRGLTAEDFVVLDGGEPREVIAFEAIDLAAPPETGPREAPPGASGTSGRGRHFLLLVDLMLTRRELLVRSLPELREWVAHGLDPRDRLAVGIVGGAGNVVLLTGFVADAETRLLALDQVEAILGAHGRRQAELASELRRRMGFGGPRPDLGRLQEQLGIEAALLVDRAYGRAPGGGPASGLGRDRDAPGEIVRRPDSASLLSRALPVDPGFEGARVAGTIVDQVRGIARLVTLLRDLPTPKHLVLVSEGFPSAYLSDPFSEERAQLMGESERMFEAFRRSGWDLRAIDAEGVPAAGAPAFDAQALAYWADGTGGEVIENHNRLETAAAEVLENTRVTYLLTFRAEGLEADGSFHPIDVRLREGRPRTRLLHRPGYYAPRPPAARSELERGLETAKLVLENRDVAGVRVAARGLAPPAGGIGRAGVPVLVSLAGPELLPEPEPRGKRGRRVPEPTEVTLRVGGWVLDASGRLADRFSRALVLPVERLRGPVSLLERVELPEGEYRLRLLVEEPDRDRVTVRPVPLDVPSGERPALAPPVFFVDRSEDADGLFLAASDEAVASALGGLLGAGSPLPVVAPRVAPGERLRALVSGYSLGDGVRIGGRLLDAAGEPVAPAAGAPPGTSGRFTLVARVPSAAPGEPERLVAEIDTSDLAPGEYRLEVTAEEGGAGPPLSSVAVFEVGE